MTTRRHNADIAQSNALVRESLRSMVEQLTAAGAILGYDETWIAVDISKVPGIVDPFDASWRSRLSLEMAADHKRGVMSIISSGVSDGELGLLCIETLFREEHNEAEWPHLGEIRALIRSLPLLSPEQRAVCDKHANDLFDSLFDELSERGLSIVDLFRQAAASPAGDESAVH